MYMLHIYINEAESQREDVTNDREMSGMRACGVWCAHSVLTSVSMTPVYREIQREIIAHIRFSKSRRMRQREPSFDKKFHT